MKAFVESDEVSPWMSRTPSNDQEIVTSRLSTCAEEVHVVRSTLLARKPHDAQVPINNTFRYWKIRGAQR